MGIIRVQHSLQDRSGLPEDQYVNTWYFSCSGAPTETLSNAAASAVSTFYSAGIGGAVMTSYLSNQLSGHYKIKTYDMADALPRTPIADYEGDYTGIAVGSGVGLPTEVAACLSFKAAPVVGIPAARLRGRVYIGPLDVDNAVQSLNNQVTISTTFLDRLVKNAANMAEVAAALDLTWCVYSPTRVAASTIVECWADNAFDIQRRRGNDATTRVMEAVG